MFTRYTWRVSPYAYVKHIGQIELDTGSHECKSCEILLAEPVYRRQQYATLALCRIPIT